MLERLNQLVWSDAMVVAMLAAGLCFCIRLRFVQLLHPLKIAKCTVFSLFGRQSRTRETGSLSQLQVLSTTLAATMGTGNIVGVATALTIGGAGAVFWMWVSAVLGMGLVYAENVLGSRYRFRDAKGN